MAQKESKSSTKSKVKETNNTTIKNEDKQNTIIKETITVDNNPIFNKILVCLYIIIALLAVNIVVTAIGGGNGIRNYNTSSSGDNNGNGQTQNNGDNEEVDYDVSSFTAIDANGMVEAFNSSDYKLIYLGRPNCGFCVKFVPVLTEVQKNYKFTTLYLDINTVTSEEDYNKIIDLNNDFFTNREDQTAYGITPMVLIVKDGEIVDYNIGHVEYDRLEQFVSKYFEKK